MNNMSSDNERNVFTRKRGAGAWLKKNGYYLLLVMSLGVITGAAIWGLSGNEKEGPQLMSTPTPTAKTELYFPTAVPTDKPVHAEPTQTPSPTKPVSNEPIRTSTFVDPVNNGVVLTEYSMDVGVYSDTLAQWTTHNGIDFSASDGSDVFAAANGRVLSVTDDTLMGLTVVIDHGDGLLSYYSCMGESLVSEGHTVVAGQIIGKVGNTAIREIKLGPHLHFAATQDGRSVDPTPLLPGGIK